MTEIVSPRILCTGFPVADGPQISRDNMLRTLSNMLSEVPLVIVEGPQGMGKTTLLAQFAARHDADTVSLFVRSTSTYAYDPQHLLTDLCTQLHFILYARELESDASDAILHKLVATALRRRRERPVYIVVDGLCHIPATHASLRDTVLGWLPFDYQQFRIVLGGACLAEHERVAPLNRKKSFPLPGFTVSECEQLLGATATHAAVKQVYQITGGVPEFVSAIARTLATAPDAEVALAELPATLPQLFQLEWTRAGLDAKIDSPVLLAIAVVAFADVAFPTQEIAAAVGARPAGLQSELERCSFLRNVTNGEPVRFATDQSRTYARSRLARFERAVDEVLVRALSAQPDSSRSLMLLPSYLQRRNEGRDLLEYLSTPRVALMVDQSQMRSPAQRNAKLGVEAAFVLKRDQDLVRLGLLSSELHGGAVAACSRGELEALMAVGEDNQAVALAAGCTVRSDRLRALALIARKRREGGFAVEQELVDQLEELVQHYESRSAEDDAELAGDLLCVRSDLAFKVLERAQKDPAVDPGTHDWAYAKVSMEAAASEHADVRASEEFRRRIRDPELSKIAQVAALSLRRRSASEIIGEVERVESAADQMYLFRKWALHARSSPELFPVLERALTKLLGSSDVTPTAKHLRELATPLPLVSDDDQAGSLIATIDALAGTAKQLGPTEEYVRLQCIIAMREARHAFHAAADRMIQTYLEVGEHRDLATRAACWAHLAAALPGIDPEREWETRDKLHSLIEDALTSVVTELLDSTADHFHVTRRIVEGLARTRARDALAIAKQLNTERQRDQALRAAISAALGALGPELPLAELADAVDEIAESSDRAHALDEILSRVDAIRRDEVLRQRLPEVIPIIGRARAMDDGWVRAVALCRCVGILARAGTAEHADLLDTARIAAGNAWAPLDEGPAKVELGFHLASLLAGADREAAQRFVAEAEQLRKSVGGQGEEHAYVLGVRLAGRAACALVAIGADAGAELAQFRQLLKGLTSVSARAVLAGEVALGLYRKTRDSADALVEEFVRPALRRLENSDVAEWKRVLGRVAPALLRAHPASALEEIAKLKGRWRDFAVARVLVFLVRGVSPDEPFEDGGRQRSRLSYQDAIDAVNVLPYADSDALLYYGIQLVCRDVGGRDSKSQINRDQRESIRARLDELVESKLPNPRFIRHSGYKVACKAELARLQKKPDLAKLVAEAAAIPNRADAVFVSTIVADACAESKMRDSVLKTARSQVSGIPFALDRAHRLQAIAEVARGADAGLAKSCIAEALSSASDGSDVAAQMRRSLVDVAFAIDAEWAETIAAAADDDPARQRARREVQGRVATRKLKAAVAEDKEAVEFGKGAKEHLPSAAWMLLGGLNAGRIAAVSLKRTRECVRWAASLPLADAYPVWAWAIENLRSLPRKAGESELALRSVYQASAAACDLATRLAKREVSAARQSDGSTGVVGAGERENALAVVQEFLRTHASSFIKIADPFLGPEEIAEVLRFVRVNCPNVEIGILTSRKQFMEQRVEQPWEDAVERAWKEISDQKPPSASIVIAGLGASGDSPVHDRWWVMDRGGLRVGTSLSGLGQRRVSEVTELRDEELVDRLAEIDDCLNTRRREQGGEKIRYLVVPL